MPKGTSPPPYPAFLRAALAICCNSAKAACRFETGSFSTSRSSAVAKFRSRSLSSGVEIDPTRH